MPTRPPHQPTSGQLARRGFLALAGISLTGALAACAGQGTAASGGTKHIRLSTWNIPTDITSYQAIADEFVAEHPGTSVAVEVTTGQFHQWFITRLAADLAPDVIRITPQQIGRYAANGSLVDISGSIPADYREDYSKPFWAIGAREDGIYGVFQHTDNFITYYNREVMERIGVTPPSTLADAWTWDEFLNVAKEVKQVTGKYAFGYGWGGPETAYRWLPLVYQNGGAFLGDDGLTPSMDTPEAIDALAFGRKWYAEGLATTGNLSKTGGGDVARNLFMTGQVGMMLNNPEPIVQLDDEMQDNWGTAPMIRNVGEASDLGGNALAVTKSSKHPELAAELVAMITSRKQMQRFCHDGNWLPARKSLDAKDIGYQANTDTMQRFIDQGTTIPLSMVKAESGQYFSSLNAVFADYLDLCLLGQLSPKEASDQMMEAMRSVTAN